MWVTSKKVIRHNRDMTMIKLLAALTYKSNYKPRKNGNLYLFLIHNIN